ncbi:binding-protein-dependent transport systems inner membrane component [Xylanimonas cellulosilytica DSM 15894]|uniref:Binding-protein-dependent transport systems inner membrane component n=1 Tax=Xylanimonas cellulosilytica (strain DSM 15894 / JCM 12276 / CECT 5975 / KCTC 9989 / LMG 20990 / NBRC 107835 / XIL07) TaxID=446471 RepID=D1C0G6_XYLCX|nr:ABC transporter permease [Xylanimonas cellulosilytica]ACZ32169.1 binding-protein-dependent transport systems inner membrane component [Xylanimonas cellulosilytica DSM 15894]
MVRLVAGRVAAVAGLLIVISVIVFGLVHLAPGDLARTLIGTRQATPEAIAAIRAAYHLDDPLPVQYWTWLSGVLQGDLGTSVRTGSPVATMIGERLGYTGLLSGLAAVLALAVGVPLGVLAARYRGRLLDRAVVAGSVVGVAAPTFAVSLLLLYVLGLRLGWFPIYGTGDGGLDTVHHFLLPAIALATGLSAVVVKVTRAAVVAELDLDYVTFARARGLGSLRVARLYLTNAAGPVLAAVGLTLTALVGGAVLVEVTFALPGLGSLLVDSITFKDVPVVQSVTLLVAALVALVALAVDLLHLAADPRLRRRAVVR